MNPKIAIIIPTIDRDKLLVETVNSILENWIEDFKIIIIDQNPIETYSEEKKVLYAMIKERLEVIQTPYDSGLSLCRNLGVERAKSENIPYCLISADNIQFNNSMKKVIDLVPILEKYYDLIGMGLNGSICAWEGELKLKEGDCFEINFLDRNKPPEFWNEKDISIWNCDITRNFFIATTESLSKVKWDNNLKMREHEDFFHRYRLHDNIVGFTDYIEGQRIKDRSGQLGNLRAKNMGEGFEYLKKKYSIKQWIKYKNLELAKKWA